MLTNGDIARLLTPGLKTEFFKGYAEQPVIFPLFTTEIPSDGADENYAWLGENPELREWVDERAPKKLLENGFKLVNKDYEASLSVDRNTIADDRYGQVKFRAMRLGRSARRSMDKIAATTIEAGTSTVCYDGQYFFDTDHSEGASGTQSNYQASSYALAADKVKLVISAMEGFKNDQGTPSGVIASHIMVPTGLKFTAFELFNPAALKMATDPSKVVLSGILEIIVNPFLTNAGTVANSAWYVLDLTQAVRPFIFQNRKEIEFAALDKTDDYANFMRKEIFYGVDARFAFGFGDWKLAYKAQG